MEHLSRAKRDLWKRLDERVVRERLGRSIVEGVKSVEDAIKAGWPIEAVVDRKSVV